MPSANALDCAPGMLVLGQGSRRRARIGEHYGLSATKVSVELLIGTSMAASDGYPQATNVIAEAYLTASYDDSSIATFSEWRLQDFLNGEYLD